MGVLQLSVVVPARNAQLTIEKCLCALLASDLTRDRWELIVVDDASEDSTAQVAAIHADRVLRISAPARGPAFARNFGARDCNSQFIAFVDADISVHPDALRRMVELITSSEDIAAVFGSYDDSPTAVTPVSQYRNLLHRYVHLRNAGEAASFWAGCGMIRRDAFDRAGGYDENRYVRPQIEDVELGYRLRAAGQRIVLDPAIQCKHHKIWSFRSMVRTDFRDRAIPWISLLLSTQRQSDVRNPSLGLREMIGTFAAGAFAVAAAAAFFSPAAGLIAAAVFLCVSVLANHHLFRWFARKRGALFVIKAVPLHICYQLTSALAVPVGIARHALQSITYRGNKGVEASRTSKRFTQL